MKLDKTSYSESAQLSEEQIALAETFSDGFWVVGLDGRLLYANQAYLQLSGYGREELLTMHVSNIEARENSEDVSRHVEKIINKGSDIFEGLHRTKDGTVWEVEVNAVYRYEDRCIFAFLRDVRNRKRAEKLLQIRQRLVDLSMHAEVDMLMQTTLDEAELFTGSRIGFFHFVDPDQENLTLQTWSSTTIKTMCAASGKGAHYPISKAGVWVDCFHKRCPVIHNDYGNLSEKKGLPKGHVPVIRVLSVPVIRGKQVVAILGVGNKTTDYTEADVNLIDNLASFAIDLVIRKKLEEEREELLKRLIQNQQTLNTVINAIPQAVFWKDKQGRYLGSNKTFASWAGLENPEMVVGLTDYNLPWKREESDRFRSDDKSVIDDSKEKLHYIEKLHNKDGQSLWIETSKVPLKDSFDNALGVLGVCDNITERRKLEENYHRLASLTSDYVHCCTRRENELFRIKWLDGAVNKISGYSTEEIYEKGCWFFLVHPDDKQFVSDYLHGLKPGDSGSIEFRIITKSRGIRWVHEKSYCNVGSSDEELLLLGAVSDITERKQLEASREELISNLHKSVLEQKCLYAVAKLVAESYMSILDVIQGVVDILPHAFRCPEHICIRIVFENSEFTTNNFAKTATKIAAKIKVDNKPVGHLEVLRLAADCAESNELFTLEERELLDSVARQIGNMVERERAKIVAEKEAKELQKNRETLDTVLNTIPLGIFWKDIKGRYLGCNKVFAAAVGLKTTDEIVGLTDYDLPWSQKEADGFREDDRQVIKNNQPKLHIIESIKQANGQNLWFETAKTPLRDRKGNPYGVLGCYLDITERRLMDEALRVSELQLKEAQYLAHIGSWQLDLQTNGLHWSDEIFHIFEIDPQSFGASYEAFLSMVHPEDREMVDRIYRDSLKNKVPYKLVHRLLMKDGRIKYVQERCKTWYDDNDVPIRSLGTVQDITERKQVEDDLKVSRDRLAQVAEQSRTIIWEVNAEGLYTYISPVCENVLGYLPEEIVGHLHFYDLHPEDGREEFRANAFAVFDRREKFVNFINLAQTRDGQQVWLSTNGIPVLDGDGSLKGYRGSDMDVTAQKELEYQNMRAAQLAAVGELASGIAHEINNPVTGVINYAQFLLNKPNYTDKDREVLGRIIKEGNRIASIVRDLLFFSRDSGKQRSITVAQKMLEDVLTLARKQLEKDGVDLILDLQETPLKVFVNPQQVEQVWLNLISNARHALNKRFETNDIQKELRITMKSFELNSKMFCKTTFYDNGTGIPDKIIGQIFRPFFTTKPAGVGTGLGLSISQEIVRSCGGEMTVTSKEGEFTLVAVDLPLIEDNA